MSTVSQPDHQVAESKFASEVHPLTISVRLEGVPANTHLQLRIQQRDRWAIIDETIYSSGGIALFDTKMAEPEFADNLLYCRPIDPIAVTTTDGNQVWTRSNSLSGMDWLVYSLGARIVDLSDWISRGIKRLRYG